MRSILALRSDLYIRPERQLPGITATFYKKALSSRAGDYPAA